MQFASQAERSDELGDTLSLGSPWSRGRPDGDVRDGDKVDGVDNGLSGETTSGAKEATGSH